MTTNMVDFISINDYKVRKCFSFHRLNTIVVTNIFFVLVFDHCEFSSEALRLKYLFIYGMIKDSDSYKKMPFVRLEKC